MGRENAEKLEKGYYTYNMHRWSVSPEDLVADESLNSFWEITSTSITEEGQEFIASIEAKSYPIMATQFHPEKHGHMFRENQGYNHSWESIQLNAHFAKEFVQMARANPNRWGSGYKELHPNLI